MTSMTIITHCSAGGIGDDFSSQSQAAVASLRLVALSSTNEGLVMLVPLITSSAEQKRQFWLSRRSRCATTIAMDGGN